MCVRGKQALAELLETLVASVNDAHPPTYASTLQLRQFANFLDKASHDLMNELTEMLVVGVSSSRAHSAAASSGAPTPKVVKQRVQRDVSLDAINDLFRNPVAKKPK